MKKKYAFSGLHCAHCAQQIEDQVAKLDHVNNAKVSFIMEKINIDLDEAYEQTILEQANEIANRIEPGSLIQG